MAAKKQNKAQKLFVALAIDQDKKHAHHGNHGEVFVNGTIDCVADEFDNCSGEGDKAAVYELKLVGYLTKGAITFTPVGKK